MIPGPTEWKERTNPSKLSSNLHTHTLSHIYLTLLWAHTNKYIRGIKWNKMGRRDGSVVQACMILVEAQSMVPICLSHFSIAVERHHDQGNTMTGESMAIMVGSLAAGRQL